MKNLFTLFVLFLGLGTQFLQAQNSSPLKKQETIDYIEKVYKESYSGKYAGNEVLSVECEGSIIILRFSAHKNTDDLDVKKFDLKKYDPEAVKLEKTTFGYRIIDDKDTFFYAIMTEIDANRIIKAFSHLIKLVREEKSTDPFGE